MNTHTIATRYARALFDAAVENNSVNLIKQDLISLQGIIEDNKSYKNIMLSKSAPQKMKALFVNTAINQAEFNTLTKNFIRLLIKYNKIYIIKEIFVAFNMLIYKQENITIAEITTPSPMNEKELYNIQQAMEKCLKQKIELQRRNDPKILGGFIMKVGSKMLDCSILAKLNKIKKLVQNNLIN